MSIVQLPEGFQAEYEAAETVDARDQVIDRHFDGKPVGSEQNIIPDAIFYVRDKRRQLVRIVAAGQNTDDYLLTFVLTGERTRPVPREKLLELGRDSRLLRLVPKAAAGTGRQSNRAESEPDTIPENAELPVDPKKLHPECVIDMGTLTQLLSAARQSGLLSNADQIAHVRDCEFRMGKYRRALDTIERMSVKFTQAASKRKHKLQAEDIKHKSGTLKMSPKEWQKKKQQDSARSLVIERARRKFAHVLDGLRLLARIE